MYLGLLLAKFDHKYEDDVQLGIIAPVPALRILPIGNFHLVLTSWVLENEEYANFYRERRTEGDYVILDNDAHEYKRSSPLESLLRAAEIVKPNEIVLPDAIRDSNETVKATLAAYPVIKQSCPFANLMAVVHGKTQLEWQNCAMSHIALGVDTIGIPRVYADDFDSWIPAVRFIDYWCHKSVSIHLLGGPHNLRSALEVEQAFPGRVRSTDTSKPIHYAIAGTHFAEPLDSEQRNHASRPNNFLEYDMNLAEIDLATTNIKILRQAIGHRNGI